uniref:Uncharacterized protein n=1 Tax=Arundo donax TaxID=35708 RepID=A0A0A9DU51_ARUDO
MVTDQWRRHALLRRRRWILWLLLLLPLLLRLRLRLRLRLCLCLWLHHLESVDTMSICHHPIASRVVMHSMAAVSRMTNVPNWPNREMMENLMLAGMLLVLRGVQPSFIARKVHVNSRWLRVHAAGGTAATTVAGMVRMWWVVLMRGIVMTMVLQEGTAVWEQRLGVPVGGHRRHQLQPEVAFDRLVEAPIPDAQAAVVVHLGDSNKQIQSQEPKSEAQNRIFLRPWSAHLLHCPPIANP